MRASLAQSNAKLAKRLLVKVRQEVKGEVYLIRYADDFGDTEGQLGRDNWG